MKVYKLYRRYESDIWGDLYLRGISFKLLVFLSFIFFPRYRFRFFSFDVRKTQRTKRTKYLSAKAKYFMEKQKIKHFYGNLSEQEYKQICNAISYKKTKRNQEYHFLLELERRLDTLIYRFHLAITIEEARKKVHWILADGKSRSNFSYRVGKNEIITFAHPRQIIALWKKEMKAKRFGRRVKFPPLPETFWLEPKYFIFQYNPTLTRSQIRLFFPFKLPIAQHVGTFY